MPSYGAQNFTIQIQRRSLTPPDPGSAEPNHDYTTFLTTRAEVQTAGVKEWSRVQIGGQNVTHTFKIRFTSLTVDSRDRVRDVYGNLYSILKTEDVNQRRKELKLYCARQGDETLPVVG